MRTFLLSLTCAACFLSAEAAADQSTATCECGKPESQHMLPAGDRPDHSLGVQALQCSWSKPLELGGEKTRDSVATELIEVSGARFHVRSGVHELTMQSGDKVALLYRGTGVSQSDRDAQVKGSFTIAHGTGKLKGIKGTGTFDCKSAGDSASCEVVAEYSLNK